MEQRTFLICGPLLLYGYCVVYFLLFGRARSQLSGSLFLFLFSVRVFSCMKAVRPCQSISAVFKARFTMANSTSDLIIDHKCARCVCVTSHVIFEDLYHTLGFLRRPASSAQSGGRDGPLRCDFSSSPGFLRARVQHQHRHQLSANGRPKRVPKWRLLTNGSPSRRRLV